MSDSGVIAYLTRKEGIGLDFHLFTTEEQSGRQSGCDSHITLIPDHLFKWAKSMNGTHSRYSVIVPVVGQPSALDDTLASILRDIPEGSEVILVHDGTFEDNYNIGEELTLVDAGTKRLASQFAAAFEQSNGDVIALVRPGVQLPEGWGGIVEDNFSDPSVASAVPIITGQATPDQIVAAGVKTNYHYRRMLVGRGSKLAQRVFGRLNPLGPTSWAGFYRRSTLAMIGDLDLKLEDQYFDLDLALTLKAMGYSSTSMPDCVCMVERPAIVIREAETAHGQSAQRSIARHASHESAFSRGCASFVAELFAGIFFPGLFQQAMGRLGASRFRSVDRAFAERVSEIVRRKNAIEKTGLRVHEQELSSDVSEAIERRQKRRAA